ncbi:MAG: phytanoyl-CoA dioxygenase family protein [Hyphomicrobiales bacterium]|nr:phytanoyl-CoA dioxygenase family protein [Hyphomicrobiales bacterium]
MPTAVATKTKKAVKPRKPVTRKPAKRVTKAAIKPGSAKTKSHDASDLKITKIDTSYQGMNLQLPWTESPFFKQILEKSGLDSETKKLVQAYSDDGFVVVDLDIPNFDTLAQNIQNLFDKDNPPRRIHDAFAFSEDARMLAAHPKIMDLLQLLYQREPIPFQTLNFLYGTEQGTHSDAIHFYCYPERFMCGVWIALEDIDETNGALHYYPGSHKLPVYDMATLGVVGSDYMLEGREEEINMTEYKKYEQLVQALMEAQGFEKKHLYVPKGKALVWSANLFHGGDAISDNTRTRLSQVTHYYFDQCTYYTPMLSDPYMDEGRIRWRDIYNIATQKEVKQYYCGREVKHTVRNKETKW